MNRVLITGMGCILPSSDDVETSWEHLSQAQSQLAFEPEPGSPDGVEPMGRVHGFDPARYLTGVPPRFYARYSREIQLYLGSVFNALAHARLDTDLEVPSRVGLFDGVARPGFAFWYERLVPGAGESEEPVHRLDLFSGIPGQAAGIAAALLGIRGPVSTASSTCSSGSVAIGEAFRSIARGDTDVCIASGHEASLIPPLFASYRDARLLSTERGDARKAVRPFVGFSTNAFGEGAVSLVLESEEHAARRGATPIAEILGYSYGNNGYHPLAVDTIGSRPAEVIQQLLSSTGTDIEEVAVVVGHGNAVQLSDYSEENYMRRVFGPRAAETPLVSVKPIYGHLLGASSALNAMAAALMCERDFIVPTANIDAAACKRNTNHQAGVGAASTVNRALALSYGMGGHNAALLLGKAS